MLFPDSECLQQHETEAYADSLSRSNDGKVVDRNLRETPIERHSSSLQGIAEVRLLPGTRGFPK